MPKPLDKGSKMLYYYKTKAIDTIYISKTAGEK